MPKTGLSAVLFDREDPKNKWELEELLEDLEKNDE